MLQEAPGVDGRDMSLCGLDRASDLRVTVLGLTSLWMGH